MEIANRNYHRSISRWQRSISQPMSTSRFGSPVRGTTAPSCRRTWRSRCPLWCRRPLSAPLPCRGRLRSPRLGRPRRPVPVEATAQSAMQPTVAAAEPSELPLAPGQDAPSPAASPLSKTPNVDTTPLRSILDRAPGLARPDTTPGTTRTAPVAVVSVEAIAALARPAPAVAAGRRANAQEQRAKTHTRSLAPKHITVGALGYASIGPLGAGASDRTLQLVFLIFVPFLFVFADAARRVVEERKAAAADSGRRREKPG